MVRTIKVFLCGILFCAFFLACEKEYSSENGDPNGGAGGGGGSSSGTALFTLEGAPGACSNPVINGSFVAGTALTATNVVIVSVNVTTVGTYTISSGSANGISFSGSGTFTSTGVQAVILTGTGTPTTAGTFNYTPGTNGCTFPLTVTSVPAGPVAVYTLNGAPGACVTPVIAGTYLVGVPLTSGNTITVTANVTTAGSYSISTNSVNGISFSGSGNLAIGTTQTIVLTGSGTPTAANTSSFTIGTNGCTFPITTTTPVPAVYTFDGAPGACNPITVAGTYNTGTALVGTTNTATVQVSVTVAGVYTITSTTVNGMTFSKSGSFAGTGAQTVVLAGSGTPTAAGTNTFTVGTGGCTFPVTVTAPSSPCTGLVDGKFVMTGQFTLNGISFGASLGSTYQVSIQDGAVKIDVMFPGGNLPAPGVYSIGAVTMQCLSASFVQWDATSGSVYVSVDGSGNTVVEFCNVNFKGTQLLGGPNLTSTGAGKMVI